MSLSKSESYASAGVDITAGYKGVQLMKPFVARTMNPGVTDAEIQAHYSRTHKG